MTLLYVKEKEGNALADRSEYDFTIMEFRPSVRKVYLDGEQKSVKTTLVRLWFQLQTFSKATLVCAIDSSNKALHTSYVVPKCLKFPFLRKNDYIIGPCFTQPQCRGRGIYPAVLKHICDSKGDESTRFYMAVDSKNHSSIRGIEKAGFRLCGVVKKTRVLKRYYCVKEDNNGTVF